MRVIWRSIAGLVLLIAVLAAGLYLFRGPLAGAAIRSALVNAGVENPTLKVADVSLSRLRLADVAAGDRGAPAVEIAEIDVGYDFWSLLAKRAARSISVGPGSVAAVIDDAGVMRIAGWVVPLGPREPAPLPFEDLALKDLSLSATAPEGEARGKIAGAFSREQGGAFQISAESAGIVVRDWRAADARLAGSLDLSDDGALTTRLHIEGDFATPYGEARQAALEVDAEGRSWRDALDRQFEALSGTGTVLLEIAEIPAASNPFLAALAKPSSEGAGIEAVSAKGALSAVLANDQFSIAALDGEPLRLSADRGDVFILRGFDAAPLYQRNGAKREIAIGASFTGSALTGEAAFTARSAAPDTWTYDVSASLAEQAIASVSLGATSLGSSGAMTGTKVNGQAELATLIKSAAAGPMRISNAPFAATLDLDIDLAEKTLAASTRSEECIAMERADFTVEGQDSDARLVGANLCGEDRPLIALSWGESPHTEIAGRISAREGRYRLGQTRFEGAPPLIRFTAVHDGAAGVASAEGALERGRVILNGSMIASEADGTFAVRIAEEGMSGEVSLARVRVSQNAAAPQVAPIIAAGSARLAENRVAFDYTAITPGGLALGQGEGRHDIRTGRGETRFKSGALEFRPNGLQPAGIAPGLLGIVGATTGGATADLSFGWGPKASDATSSANLEFRELTFRGPGVAVSETRGVSGAIDLSSLAPLKSGGLQTLNIRMIDLNALKLENGVVDFELPGDETLRVIDTEFPWFGGKLGIYDATASLTGETANIPLKAEAVDLAKILAFLDIEGLSGEGILSGSLPLVVKEGKASIVGGELRSDGPGAVRYVGQAAEAAGSNPQTEVAFSILRDLRFTSLRVTIDGPLDGRIDFKCAFEGTGEVPYGKTSSRLPVRYNISIDAPLLDLLNQAALTTDVGRQIELGVESQQ